MSSQLFAPDTNINPYEQLNFDALPFKQWPEQVFPDDTKPHLRLVTEDGLVDLQYRLGTPILPIALSREHILQTHNEFQGSVVSAETGSGKSSQIGLYLLEAGVPRVFVSSPRILAARKLFERAQESLGPDYANLVGYLTGKASDSNCADDARLIYVTEQLLFKMVNRGELQPGDTVINDEAHERTVGTIALLGLTKELMQDDPSIKLMISSATIDTGKFSRYLKDPRTGLFAPVLELEGRTFPVKVTHSDQPVAKVAREYMKQGKNVLGFEPGEGRLRETRNKMASRNSSHTVHILYGDQSPTEQAKALNPEDGHHVVSSRIGETSITPENKDAVVDGGLSNIGLYEEGVNVLKTVFSSRATMEQRKGRVGRTKPGEYTIAEPADAPKPPAYSDRDEYDVSAMETSSVASFLVELLAESRRLERLDLLEDPTQGNLIHDYRVLERLGAVAIGDGAVEITKIGEAMTNIPVNVSLARMVIESRTIDTHYDVDTEKVRLQVAAIVSILEVKGILSGGQGNKRRYLMSRRGDEQLSTEHGSDPLFSLDVFVRLQEKRLAFEKKNPDKALEWFEKYLEEKDILANRYYKAAETFNEVCLREGLDGSFLTSPDALERKAIICCQISGTDELFVKDRSVYWDIRGDNSRRLGSRSTIDPSLARLVIGSAFDYRGLSSQGRFQKRFIAGGTVVSKEQLLTHAPHRITTKNLGYGVTKEGDIIERKALYFDGELMFAEHDTLPEHSLHTREFIIRAMMTGVATVMRGHKFVEGSYDSKTPNATRAIRQWEKAQKLDHKSPASLMTSERYSKLINKIVRNSVASIPLDVIDVTALDEVIPHVFLNSLVRPTRKRDIPEILRRSPDAVSIQIDEDQKMYLPVTYRNNIAYIEVRPGTEYAIKPEDIAELLEHHPVKLKIGSNGQNLQSEAFFKYIEERLNAPKRLKRLERQAESAATVSTPESLAQATERVKQSRKRPANQKAADQPMARVVTKKYSHRQRRPSNKVKEIEARARLANQF